MKKAFGSHKTYETCKEKSSTYRGKRRRLLAMTRQKQTASLGSLSDSEAGNSSKSGDDDSEAESNSDSSSLSLEGSGLRSRSPSLLATPPLDDPAGLS